jgi:hypothetical protein
VFQRLRRVLVTTNQQSLPATAARRHSHAALRRVMKVLFHASDRAHGSGKVQFAWNPKGTFLASCGTNGETVFPANGRTAHRPSASHALMA